MILHGVYDNGKITITEKDLPKVKVNVEIILHTQENPVKSNFNQGIYSLSGIFDNKNLRDLAHE